MPKRYTTKRTCRFPNEGEREVEGIAQHYTSGVTLFNYKRKWWLAYYDREDHNTGPFNTKRDAAEFYENGGR